jgi:hypothetical protein
MCSFVPGTLFFLFSRKERVMTRRIHNLGFVALGTATVLLVVSRPVAAQDCFYYPKFCPVDGVVDGLNLVGDAHAVPVECVLRLVSANPSWQVGAAWRIIKQHVENGFSTKFEFRLHSCRDGTREGCADGFAFVVQNYSDTAIGLGGGNIGYGGREYGGIPNSIAVEFDIYRNSGSPTEDPDPNHISVHTRGTAPNSSDHADSLGWESEIADLPGADHFVRIEYVPGMLSIFFPHDVSNPVLTVPVDLGQTLSLDDGKAWVGFTAATGGEWAVHDIKSWRFWSYPCPECTDIGLFVQLLLTGNQEPAVLCMFDENNDGIFNGEDIQGFVDRLLW